MSLRDIFLHYHKYISSCQKCFSWKNTLKLKFHRSTLPSMLQSSGVFLNTETIYFVSLARISLFLYKNGKYVQLFTEACGSILYSSNKLEGRCVLNTFLLQHSLNSLKQAFL